MRGVLFIFSVIKMVVLDRIKTKSTNVKGEYDMPVPKIPVRCSVDNCEHNKNRMCYADTVEVNAMGDGRARNSEGTSCRTFKNRVM